MIVQTHTEGAKGKPYLARASSVPKLGLDENPARGSEILESIVTQRVYRFFKFEQFVEAVFCIPDMVALGVPLRLGGQREIFTVQNETKHVAEELQKAVVEKEPVGKVTYWRKFVSSPA